VEHSSFAFDHATSHSDPKHRLYLTLERGKKVPSCNGEVGELHIAKWITMWSPTYAKYLLGMSSKKTDDNLMLCRRHYKDKYSMQRRARIRKVSRMMEYLKGNQYYVVGPDGFSFQDPFSSDTSQGNEQGRDANDYYKYVTNIIQWFERGIVSTIAGEVTAIRFQPANASSDKGNRIAQEASRANAYMERLNDETALQQQKAS
jgi:hypothetical protein